jgi:lipopolysaccharide/colanic/teichoic acid biosynthesis glycosyltransferase
MVAPTKDEAPGMLTNIRTATKMQFFKYEHSKRILDFALSLILLVVTSPLILTSLLVVWLGSKGSPLYSQRRMGHQGRIITIYKIRTMYEDSERNCGPVWSGPGDPRVTPVGRILRSSHVDELPQLVNVLRGEMSLIGPRPERPEIVTQLEGVFPRYRDRLRVRPGLTGLAQVLQAPDTDLHSVNRKLNYDLFYMDHAGFWFDVRIALATLFHVMHVPVGCTARICHLRADALPIRDEPSAVGERIVVGSQVQPYYVN